MIKSLLHEKRKTLKEVSRETAIPYSTLYTWLENRQPKDILKVQRLSDYFEVSMHKLLFGREDLKQESVSEESFRRMRDEVFKGVFEIVVKKLE